MRQAATPKKSTESAPPLLPTKLPRPALLAGLALVAAAAFATGLSGIWDPDFFHHLAAGRAIARGTSFATDPFLFPLAGQPSGWPPYWLGSLVLYLASLPAGPEGAVVLAALVGAALFALLFLDATAEEPGLPGPGPARLLLALALVVAALPELRIRSAPRPEAFGLLLLAFTLLAVHRYEAGRPRALRAFPLVALLWTQLHVSVVMGLGVVGLLVLDRLARRDPSGARTPALALAGGVVAAVLSPSPTGPLPLAWRFLRGTFGAPDPLASDRTIEALRQYIVELQVPGPHEWLTRPFALLVALGLLSFAVHRTRGWPRELATLAAFAAFAASGHRFLALAAFVAAPLAARNLGAALDRLATRGPRARLAAPAAAALVALAALGVAGRLALLDTHRYGLAVERGAFPERAAAYLREVGFAGRLYNDLGSGGYLEWTLDRPVYQDGRGLVPPGDLGDLLPEPVDPERMARLAARYGLEAIVTPSEIPANADADLLLQLNAGRDPLADRQAWALVAVDDRAALFLRRDGPLAARAARDEYRFLVPGAPLSPARLAQPGYADGLRQDLQRCARESPGAARCRLDLARLLVDAGRLDEAERTAAEVRAIGPERVEAELAYVEAVLAERRRDYATAARRYREAAARASRPIPLRRALARVLLDAGREAEAREVVEELLAGSAAPEAPDLRAALELARRAGDAPRVAVLTGQLEAANARARAHERSLAGVGLRRQGQLQEALAAFKESVALDPGDANTRTHLGLLLLDLGDPASALPELVRAAELAPTLPEAWYGVGAARDRLGDRTGAGAAYRRFLSLAPAGPLSAGARARLAALGM